MTRKTPDLLVPRAPPELTRRTALTVAGAVSLSAVDAFRNSHGLQAATPSRGYSYRSDPEHANVVRRKIHEGKGEFDVKFFFREGEMPSNPAILLLYDLPPGTSEGVHTHNVGDPKEGSFDEFYYILSGSGEMEIAGTRVPVKAGDHVFTPNGVSHGIENTAREGNLKVYLVAMRRD